MISGARHGQHDFAEVAPPAEPRELPRANPPDPILSRLANPGLILPIRPEAMRRLADLQLEKEFGILGADLSPPPALATVEVARVEPESVPARMDPGAESGGSFEQRATASPTQAMAPAASGLDLPDAEDVAWAGPEEAIVLYDKILAAYPDYAQNDQVLYQKARAPRRASRAAASQSTRSNTVAPRESGAYSSYPLKAEQYQWDRIRALLRDFPFRQTRHSKYLQGLNVPGLVSYI